MWPGPGALTELNAAKDKKDALSTSTNFHSKQKYGFKEYFADKKAKLQDQFGVDFEGPKKSSIFEGIAIWINGHTDPSSKVLRQLVGEHGGRYDLYEAPETTHWICSWLPHAKVRLLRGTERVIKPSWIVDSIAAGRLLPEQDYSLLPDLGFARPKTSLFKPQRAAYSTQSATVVPHAAEAPLSIVAKDSGLSPEIRVKLFDSSKPPAALTVPAHAAVPPPLSLQPAPLLVPAAAVPTSEDRLNAFKTAKDDGFLESYRKSSRLHYLSTWKAQFQESLSRELRTLLESDDAPTPVPIGDETAEIEGADVVAFRMRVGEGAAPCLLPHSGQEEPDEDFEDGVKIQPKQAQPTNGIVSVIVHCDMDCFFASVAQVSDPALKAKPVVVCHSSASSAVGHSDVASASYEARAFGIRNGMSLGKARQLCPELKTAPYQFDKYAQISRSVYALFVKYSRRIQAISCDEAYFELRAPSYSIAEEKVQRLRQEIVDATGCTASAGLGTLIHSFEYLNFLPSFRRLADELD